MRRPVTWRSRPVPAVFLARVAWRAVGRMFVAELPALAGVAELLAVEPV